MYPKYWFVVLCHDDDLTADAAIFEKTKKSRDAYSKHTARGKGGNMHERVSQTRIEKRTKYKMRL